MWGEVHWVALITNCGVALSDREGARLPLDQWARQTRVGESSAGTLPVFLRYCYDK